MTSSRYPQITDELLSAYIDDMVTEGEKALIEAALLAEPEVAWRLETLRYTVNLLHALPTVALPRSFTLSDIQVATGAPQPVASVTAPVVSRVRQPGHARSSVGGFGEWWQNFWQFGNLFLRNAAAASLAIFLVLSISNFVIANRMSPALRAAAPAQNASEPLPEAIAEAPKPTTIATATPAVANAQMQSQALAQQTIAVQAEVASAATENQNPPSTAFSKVSTNASAASAQPQSPMVQASAGVIRSAARSPGPAGGSAGANELAPEQPNAGNAPAAASDAAAPAIAAKGQTTNAYSDSATSQVQASAAVTAAQSLTQSSAAVTTTAALSATQMSTIENTPTVSAVGRADNNSTSAVPTPKPTQLVASRGQQPLAEGGRRSLLQIAQLVSALVTLVFIVLWWRSRATTRQLLE